MIELRYVPRPGDARLDREGLERYVRKELWPEIAIKLVPVREIPRAPTAKFLYHLCEVERPARSGGAEGSARR